MERKQINLRVSKEQKERWEAHVEESPDVNTTSDLIRMAVERRIASDRNGASGGDGGGSGVAPSPEVLDAVDALDDEIATIQERMAEIERHVRIPPERINLPTRVYSALPPFRPHSEEWQTARLERPREYRRKNQPIAWDGRIPTLADQFETDTSRIEDVIDHLRRTESEINVSTVTDETGEQFTVYWRGDE